MGGTTFVVAGEDGFEGCNTVAISLLDTAKVCRVPAVCSIVVGLRGSTVRITIG